MHYYGQWQQKITCHAFVPPLMLPCNYHSYTHTFRVLMRTFSKKTPFSFTIPIVTSNAMSACKYCSNEIVLHQYLMNPIKIEIFASVTRTLKLQWICIICTTWTLLYNQIHISIGIGILSVVLHIFGLKHFIRDNLKSLESTHF